MRKVFLSIVSFILVFSLVGCTMSSSITYDVLNENIKVTLSTSQGYKLVDNGGQFEVQDKEGESILDIVFINKETYDSYIELIEGTKLTINGNDCVYYTVNGEAGIENDYFVDISDSDVYVIVGSLADSTVVDSIVRSLTFEGVD